MSVSPQKKHNKEFVDRCKRHLQILSRNKRFISYVKDIRFDYQVEETNAKSFEELLSQLDLAHIQEHGDPKNQIENLRLPSEQLRIKLKEIMHKASLDYYWFEPLKEYVWSTSVEKSISKINQLNGVKVEYVWDERYGGETIKLTVGMSTNKKQLDEAMYQIKELQDKYGSEPSKKLKSTRGTKQSFNKELALYDLKTANPSLIGKKLTEEANKLKSGEPDLEYNRNSSILKRLSEDISNAM